jgi:hypothetical protein
MDKAPKRPLKSLASLIRLLRAQGVTEYRTPELTLRFAAASEPAPDPPVIEPGETQIDPRLVERDTPDDPRYFLEQIATANRPRLE